MMYDRILNKKLETKLDNAEILYKRMGGYVESLHDVNPNKQEDDKATVSILD